MDLSFVEENKFDKVTYTEIGPEQEGQRLDNFLIRHLKGVPKSRIYNLLRKGEVRINKGRVKPDTRIKEGDIVRKSRFDFNFGCGFGFVYSRVNLREIK